MWDPVLPALTAAHDVVRLDLRGSASRRPSRPAPGRPAPTCWRPSTRWASTARTWSAARSAPGSRSRWRSSVPPRSPPWCWRRPGAPHHRADGRPAGLLGGRGDGRRGRRLRRGRRGQRGRVGRRTASRPGRRPGRGPRRGPRDAAAGLRRSAETWDREAVERLEDELDPPPSERYAELAAPTLVLSGALDIDAIGQAADRPGCRGARRPRRRLARRRPRALDGAARRLRRAGARLGGRALLARPGGFRLRFSARSAS